MKGHALSNIMQEESEFFLRSPPIVLWEFMQKEEKQCYVHQYACCH